MMRGVTSLQNSCSTLIGVHSAMHVMHAPHLRHYNYYVHACLRTSVYSIACYDFIAMYIIFMYSIMWCLFPRSLSGMNLEHTWVLWDEI